ncbi:hypothetical protein D6C77_10792 [Aureobasidium pullulans]|nr:hypothetical protein D6C77_10792 [Aureobasidium pullulans]
MLNLDLTRFERESVARLREEEARYKGVIATSPLTTLRRRVKELSANSPSVRYIPTSCNKEDPTLMSRGAGGLVNPTSNASSPYVRPSPTNDLDTRRRADRATEKDYLATLERN